ncbi:hypothetical protein DPMN_105523 [Dreissena polymorpha]|uniref:Uncharacterized protein n=1 Tax=Dreissena polymorpha TaxID=45954 RepID=A0A9D4K3C4_DREPO|nr:hypothetical protein DPMN_105523 [Dreissena polymorpha]
MHPWRNPVDLQSPLSVCNCGSSGMWRPLKVAESGLQMLAGFHSDGGASKWSLC